MSEQASPPEPRLWISVWQDGHSTVFAGVDGRECIGVVRTSCKNSEVLFRMAKAIAQHAKEWMEKEDAPK